MPKKSAGKSGEKAKVTFELKDVEAETVHVAGDWNGWSTEELPLTKRKDGRFSGTVTLPTGQLYKYRYVLDGSRWENDPEADAYEPNEHGSDDCVIDLR